MAARTPSGGDSDRSFAYLFEAKGIQRYVLDSGLLRDLVGASDMVAGLADSGGEEDLVRQVISAAIPDGERPEFSRRAGGSFSLHSENRERLDQVRALWRLVAMLRCPGLEMADSLGQADGPNDPLGALERAYERASGLRDNTVADLPPFGGPVTEFVRRTGRPATGTKAYSAEEAPIQLDAVTEPQRSYADARGNRRSSGPSHQPRTADATVRGRLAQRFLPDRPEDGGPPYRFPRNYAAGEEDEPDNPLFPFLPTDTRIAVIHADLSGLGQTYSKAGERVRERDGGPQELLKLSESIEAAITAAAKGATMRVLLPHAKERGDHKEEARDRVVPARPVLLGGDDITIIVRADLALRFAEELLAQIETQSQDRLHEHRRTLEGAIPQRLSACAGIAIVKRGQPLLMAHALADDLCKFAKAAVKGAGKQGGAFPSALAFHLVGSSLQEDYEDAILPNEMTVRPGEPDEIRLTANPYWVGGRADGDGHRTFGDLLSFAATLENADVGRGRLRELRTRFFGDPGAVSEAWARWREVLRKREEARAGNEKALPKIDALLRRLGVSDPEKSVITADGKRTPLFDALDLIDLKTELPKGEEQPG